MIKAEDVHPIRLAPCLSGEALAYVKELKEHMHELHQIPARRGEVDGMIRALHLFLEHIT